MAFQVATDTRANWLASNRVPLAGEECFETDTNLRKFGDGATAYATLPYAYAPQSASALPSYAPLVAANRFDPIRSAYNLKASNTRNLRAGLARARTGTAKCRILRTGASISYGLSTGGDTFSPNQNGPTKYLLDAMTLAGYPVTSTGWVPCVADGSGLGRKDSRWTFAAGATGSPVGGSYFATSSTTGATYTFVTDVAGTSLDILTLGSGGAISYKIGAATAVNVTMTGSYQIQKVTAAATIPAGTTIVVTALSATLTYVGAIRVSTNVKW